MSEQKIEPACESRREKKVYSGLDYAWRAGVLLFLLLLCLTSKAGAVEAGPQTGQIIRDPNHPQWLMRKDGEHVLICGPGDPEDFLYRGTRNQDGTRSGDQEDIINRLIAHGGNSIYMQAIRSHGGDGDSTHNPFTDSNPSNPIDQDILDQWETWFTLMDDNNILIYLFFYDDGAIIWSGDSVTVAEENMLTTIVNRFKHHKNLIWLVGEESVEQYSVTRVQNIAQVIADKDEYDHIIGDHRDQNPSTFSSYLPEGPLVHHSLQYNVTALSDVHQAAVTARSAAEENGWFTIYAENTSDDGTDAINTRDHIWATVMGGLNVMRLRLLWNETPDASLQACRILQLFFESTDFYTMDTHDELALEGTEYVLANPGTSYIAYARDLSGHMGISGVPAGNYTVKWLDGDTGTTFSETIAVAGSGISLTRPGSIGTRCAIYVVQADVIEFSSLSSQVVEAAGSLSITLTRSGNSLGPASVKVSTENGTATTGTDFIGIGAHFPGSTWETRSPEEVGLDKTKFATFMNTLSGDVVVVRNGYLVGAKGDITSKADWASCLKPIISAMVWFAIENGVIPSFDAPVRPWVQSRYPEKDLSAKDQSMTFRHLSNMMSGYARGEVPGAAFAYNDYAIQLYCEMVRELYGKGDGETAMNEIVDALWSSLQFEDGSIFHSGRNGNGVYPSPRDFARFAWWMLNRGNWQGSQLVPPSHFDQDLKVQVPVGTPRTSLSGSDYLAVGTVGGDTDQWGDMPGLYGMNIWYNGTRADSTKMMPSLPEDTYLFDGHFGKEQVVIIPSLGIVCASRSNTFGGLDLDKLAALVDSVTSTSSGTVTVSWGAGETESQTISIDIVNDSRQEESETFTVHLSAAEGGVLGTKTTHTVTITTSEQTCPGDTDLDGDVDGQDAYVMSLEFGSINCSNCLADFNNDNNVDADDLLLFSANFGRTDCL